MNKKETIQVLTILGSNYKSIDDKLKDKDRAKILLETWSSCLEDLPYDLCMIAVKKAIITSSYPPTIHDIRIAAAEITRSQGEDATPTELWNEALKMIKKGSYMTKDEFEKHSEPVKRFFGDVGQLRELAATDMDTVATVTRGQFLKQVAIIQERQRDLELLPANMRDAIGKIKLGGSNNGIKKIEDGTQSFHSSARARPEMLSAIVGNIG